ncbi:MAG: hypothetical protein Q9174_003672 [Haloplaca sp. 1 TL-2023]
MAPIKLVATLTPHPEKMDRCIEVLETAAQMVHKSEPGALQYQLHVETNGDERGESVVFLEQYEDQAALDAHRQGQAWEYMSKAMASPVDEARKVLKSEFTLSESRFDYMQLVQDDSQAPNPIALPWSDTDAPQAMFVQAQETAHYLLIIGVLLPELEILMLHLDDFRMPLSFRTSPQAGRRDAVPGHPIFHIPSAVSKYVQPSMVITKEDLLAHSRYIRNTLAPKVAVNDGLKNGAPAFDLSILRAALNELDTYKMTSEVLSFSRFEKAMQRIVEPSAVGWPPDIVARARDLLSRWEHLLGPLQRVRTDFWAVGGRLEGLQKPAACRDGIVNNPYYHITADEDVAYAIAMTQLMESNCSKYESCSYTAQAGDPGIFKLMATINGEQRKVIRVLRSWKLHSPLAPSAGLRYDGLYRVTGYGVKSSYELETKSYNWRYTFHLTREPGQEGMQKSLAVPSADQLDDWQDYIGGPTYSPEEMLMEEVDEVMARQNEKAAYEAPERHDSVDSGYFSPDPASSKR